MKIGKTFSKIGRGLLKFKIRPGRNPVNDWLVICFFTVICLVLLSGTAAWRFYSLTRSTIAGSSPKTGSTSGNSDKTIDVKKLESVISSFAASQAKFNAIENGSETFTDPSN